MFNKSNTTPKEENVEMLKKEFYEVIEELHNNDKLFDLISDPKLIEACIYERKAITIRAERLLKLIESYNEGE